MNEAKLVGSLVGFSCVTPAGPGADALWHRLLRGKIDPVPYFSAFSADPQETKTDILVRNLNLAFEDLKNQIPESATLLCGEQKRLGVIYASTKGAIDDHVWSDHFKNQNVDTLHPVLENFLKQNEMQPGLKICISNACASVIAAVYLTNLWFKCDLVDHVLILAGDVAGPFVSKGFQSLKLVSPDQVGRPFSEKRNGFVLGEAVTALFISKELKGSVYVEDVQLDSEGSAVSRPNSSNFSLLNACQKLQNHTKQDLDLILAHGTGTVINDMTEDDVFSKLYMYRPPITCSKWSVGHTLGTSAGIDIILATKIFEHQTAFTIGHSEPIDPKFLGRYVQGEPLKGEYKKILITSLGFGGVHGALVLSQAPGFRPPTSEQKTNNEIQIMKNGSQLTFSFPSQTQPAWASLVDRWHQLDAASYGLAELYSQKLTNFRKPDLILLATPSASNWTDYDFATSNPVSPAKFVHTLPNIRSAPLLKVMGHTCPVLCFQDGKMTIEQASNHAKIFVSNTHQVVWILTLDKTEEKTFVAQCVAFERQH